ncbi:MAG: RnfABCDGE type electron transport complex subunit G [Ruminococcaceae bacterium]|nr:RnfABCDGE type electron transport complex subunit G [Oscillospiraceae bacterium]
MEDVARKELTPVEMLMVGLKLLIVCAVVAAVVAGVNFLTEAKYAENLTEQKRQAISEIYMGMEIEYRRLNDENSSEIVYEVLSEGSIVGYCVEVASPGFGGDITMMVGFEADRSVRGVSIVSLNETPGLGSKVNDPAFLGQYRGAVSQVAVGEEIDAITGATISSKAVTAGVNLAMNALERCVVGGAVNE